MSVGVDEVNFDLCPDETYQRAWLKVYLEERAHFTGNLGNYIGMVILETRNVLETTVHNRTSFGVPNVDIPMELVPS